MNNGFIIYGLPRSRTFWLSRFLSYGAWTCGHDEARHARTLEDIKLWFSQPFTGTVETAAAPWWRAVETMAPGTRTVVIRRDPADVCESLHRLGLGFDSDGLRRTVEKLDKKLDQIERRIPNVLSIRFDALAKEDICAKIFEFCLQTPFDPAWYAQLSRLNLQCDMRAMLRYAKAYAPQMEKLGRVISHKIKQDFSWRKETPTDGMTIQYECFDEWFRDAAPLFRDHMMATEQDIDDYNLKNIPVLRAIDKIGLMQITTARSNGRMFGYLMTVLSPSLDAENVMSAIHLPFYASPDVPGLGMKLQRAALNGLRERGVHEVFGRAGVRGSGPRLGAVYKRLGAEDVGRMYRIPLSECA